MKRICYRCRTELPEESDSCPRCLLETGFAAVFGATPKRLLAISEACSGPDSTAHSAQGLTFPAAPFGEYELLEEIARGGMGIVYKARQRSLKRIVALKLILSGQFASKQEVLRFRGEAEAAANLHHPNIVAIYETGELHGQHYFSMEYIHGRNLGEIVRDGILPAQRAARYIERIACAIHYAHQQGTLHRDLKPSNVLIDAEDQPRITDFGLAKRLHGDFGLTVTGQVLGSPGFMPPEQTSGKRTEVGPQSDVYGIGAILYYLVTGRPPFQADTIAETLHQLREQEPAPPRLLNASVPIDLETICLKCLDKDPAKRYATAQALGEEIGRFLRDEPIRARPAGRVEKLWRWCRRKPLVAGLAAAVAIALGFGISGVLWESVARKQALLETRRQLYAADMKGAQQAWADGNTTLLASFLEKHRPKPGEADLRGFEWRYLWRLLREDDRARLYPQPGGSDIVSFSANGRSLISVCRDTRIALLWKINGGLASGSLKPQMEFTNVVYAAFSPAEPFLALADGQGRIRLWDSSTERDTTLVIQERPAISALVFTRDGAALACASTNGEIRLWSAKDGQTISRFNCDSVPSVMAISPDGRWLGAGSASNTVHIWNLASGALRSEFTFPSDVQPNGLSFAPDGNKVAISWENSVKLLDIEKHQFDTEFRHHSTMKTLAISPDGHRLAVGGWGGSHLWNLETRQDEQLNTRNLNLISTVAFSKDGQLLAWGTAKGVLVRNLRPKPPFDSLEVGVKALAVSPDNQFLACGVFGEVSFWNLASNEKVRAFSTHGQNESLAYAVGGSFLLSAGDFNHVRFWNLAPGAFGEELGNIKLGGWVRCVAVSPDGKHFAAAAGYSGLSAPSAVRVWELSPGSSASRALEPLALPGYSRAVCFSPDSRYLAAANEQGLVKIWRNSSRGSWREYGTHREHASRTATALVHGCVFLKDSRTLVTGDNGGKIVLWDARRARVINTWQAHSTGIRAIVLSPDGRTLATGGYDSTVILWHTATWRAMLTLDHPAIVYALAFSPDCKTLATGCEDGTVRLWRAASIEEADANGVALPAR